MLSPADIIRLPKGQAFALIEGGGLWKLRMPLPDTRRDASLPQSLSAIAAEMERGYTTAEHWYRTPESWWYEGARGIKATDQPP